MTKVINLFGGSGLGKSTTAAGLFYYMKLHDYHVELVSEFVKEWAWDSIQIKQYDQLYIAGQQAKRESRLYDKVDYIITDSPLLLSPIYELFYNPTSIVLSSVLNFLSIAKLNGIVHYNFILKRQKAFDTRGRFETEEQAKKVDQFVVDKLADWGVDYATIDVPDDQRIECILNDVEGRWA